jgi:hypothetical protein
MDTNEHESDGFGFVPFTGKTKIAVFIFAILFSGCAHRQERPVPTYNFLMDDGSPLPEDKPN